ncbi:MAG: hypothetical protein KAF27_10800 [Porphyrobacter sp.]|nr:hypothetical protein [Porphyrobacter sp.]
MKIASRLMLAAGAASLVIAPIAAQAATRAGDSGSMFALSNPGAGRTAAGERDGEGSSIVLAIAAGGAIIAGIIVAANNKDKGQSPGT